MATQILIETEYSGITNGTERHALLGEHFWETTFPAKHGYQCVGRVTAAGAAVTQFKEDDRVFYGQYVGHKGWHVVDTARPSDVTYDTHLLFPIPNIDPEEAALLGVAGVAMRGVRRCRVGAADRVWVAGLGLIGQFAAQSARLMGAHVTVSDVHPARLAQAAACGAHETVNMQDADSWERLKAGGPYDKIFDCCGVKDLLLDIYTHQLLAYRGVVGLLAVRMETVFNWGMMHLKEASMEVSCHFSLDDLRVLAYFLREGQLHVAPLVTHRPSIDEAPEIYGMLRDRPGDLLGVVFRW
jgi:3-hydroxyethyl bacteriochlorophyllide a dehydrogenase